MDWARVKNAGVVLSFGVVLTRWTDYVVDSIKLIESTDVASVPVRPEHPDLL